MSKQRLFGWKGWLICARARAEAWEFLAKHVLDEIPESGVRDPDANYTMAEYEAATRGQVDPDYDQVDPIEYLYALDPEQGLDLEDGLVPAQVAKYDVVARPESDGGKVLWVQADVYASYSARVETWAEILPLGWLVNRDDQ